MSKTVQDYRNIVKILKLQLLKVRQQNASLSHQMGIISDSETSSFTPKINHYKQSDQPFAQKVLLFLQFAHRCELVGISPQMVFRIADKKRDKSVNISNLGEIIKRIKLRMSQQQITKLLNAMVRKGSSIEYDEYLQYLSAFQINSQKYPISSSRTYVQLCLLQFGQICKQKYPQTRKLFSEIAQSGQPYFKYDNFINFCKRQSKNLKDIQIVALFLALDIQSLCRIQRDIFQRQMDKIYSLIDRGLVDQKSILQEKAKRSPTKKPIQKNDEDDFKSQQEVGDRAFNKKKKQPVVQQKQKIQQRNPQRKATKNEVKLDKKISKDIVKTLQKNGTSYGEFIQKLIQNQKNKKDIYYRSFSLQQVKSALQSTKGKFQKKQIMKIFKQLDTGQNGSTSTQQLIKIFLRTQKQQLNSYSPYLLALFYRHLKQTQYHDPITRFTGLDIKITDQVNQKNFSLVFQKLNLQKDQIQYFLSQIVGSSKVKQFCQLLKKQPSTSNKQFQQLNKKDFNYLSDILTKIQPKNSQKSFFKKFIRNQNYKAEDQKQNWQTIFTNQWDCFQFCLKQASKLNSFWKDPQFGPTKGDPHGLRSIIGNQSQRPPCLPDDEDILWMSFDQILKKKKLNNLKTKLMNQNLKSTDVIQGKLGDCWYVSALSIITLNDQYIKGKPIQNCKDSSDLATYGIFPPLFHIFTKFGLYVFKFYKKFKPVYVVIDDLFPVQKSSNDLIFAKSPQQNLQWVAFAEKAYAKLHHTYSSMISGDIAQGLNDLTNSLPLKQILKKGDPKNINNIKNLNDKRQLMGCSIKIPKQQKSDSVAQPPYQYNDRRCGLLGGHAYSIIDYLDLKVSGKDQDGKKIDQDYELIRVRNPWGNSEWLLQWSDTPLDDDPDCKQLQMYQKYVNQYYDKKIRQAKKDGIQDPVPYTKGQDGQFLMNIQDWNQIFTNLFIGLNQTYDLVQKCYYQTFDSWGGKKPSGVCKSKGDENDPERVQFIKNNHQYILDVTQNNTEVLMLLSQQDGRLYRGQKYPYKQIVKNSIILVFKLDGEKSLLKFDKNRMVDKDRPLTMQARRDVSFWRTYEKGKYAIIPCRSQKSEKINEFQFRVYSNKNINLSKKDQQEGGFSKIQNKPLPFNGDKTAYKSLIQFLQKNNPRLISQK